MISHSRSNRAAMVLVVVAMVMGVLAVGIGSAGAADTQRTILDINGSHKATDYFPTNAQQSNRNIIDQPNNYKSPVNYHQGTWYARVDVQSKPSSKRLYTQLCMWQHTTGSRDFKYETCSPRNNLVIVDEGVYYANIGSPQDWWNIAGGTFNWSKPADMVRFFLKDPVSEKLMYTNRCGSACYPFNDINKHMPIQMDVEIIMVAKGAKLNQPSNWNCPSSVCGSSGGGGGATTTTQPRSTTTTRPQSTTTTTRPLNAPPTAESVGVFDPASGVWALPGRNGSTQTFYYGIPGDTPLLGDWDCDGLDTVGTHRPGTGFVYLSNSNSFGVADEEFYFGIPGDIPIAGDWDGDGCDTLAIFRPDEGRVYVSNSLGTRPADFSFRYGSQGDQPFAGDFDGNGKDSIGFLTAANKMVYRNQLTGGSNDFSSGYGNTLHRIVTGDWDGDGDDTPAAYQPNGTVRVFTTWSLGTPDWKLSLPGGRLPAAGLTSR